MKKIIIFVLSIVFSISLHSQTIHWITFIDTTDPNVGQIDVYGRQMLYGYFINEVNAALKQKGYDCEIQDYCGRHVSPENCKRAIMELSINNPEDIIVFYYIGHGGRPLTDSDYEDLHPYPQMCLAQDDQNKYIPLEWVDEQLSSKGARLSVTFGMCCNSVGSNITIKDEPEFSPNYGQTYMSANKIARIQELFLNSSGHIIATSASPTQTSGCFQITASPFPNPANYRDRYSYAICSFFQTQLDRYNTTLNWDDFLTLISGFVDKYSFHEQTPFHDIYPRKKIAQRHVIEESKTIKEVVQGIQRGQVANNIQKQEDVTSAQWINNLSKQLGNLFDPSHSDEERIDLEMNLNNLFSENAVVKFLAQDSDVVIDKEDVGVFLGRLSTTRLLLNVVVVEGEIDSNKQIKLLKVREIYKK